MTPNLRLCTTTRVIGLDGREHFAVVAIGQPNWPLALCGFTSGSLARKSEAEAKLFADAPVMLDMLEILAKEFGNINPAFPLSDGKMAELRTLAERAGRLLGKHRKPTQRQQAAASACLTRQVNRRSAPGDEP